MYKSGILKKDYQEIIEIQYWDIHDVMVSNEVIGLNKEIIKATWETRNGLYRGNNNQQQIHFLQLLSTKHIRTYSKVILRRPNHLITPFSCITAYTARSAR